MNEVQKTGGADTALANFKKPGRGFEEQTEQRDLIIPRAKLLQPLSPEVMETPADFRPGEIINSLTKEKFSLDEKKGCLFIPIFKFTNWVRFNPRNTEDANFDPSFEAGAIIWRSTDPMDPRVKKEGEFGPNGEPPLATKFLNFFSFLRGVPMPIIVSFSKTSYKAGKQLMSLAQFSGGDMFSKQYRLSSKLEKNDQFTYFVLTVEPAGKAQEEDFQVCESLWEQFHARELRVHEEAPEDPGAEAPPF